MFGAQLGRLVRMIARLGCEFFVFVFVFSHSSARFDFGVLVFLSFLFLALLFPVLFYSLMLPFFSDYVKMWEVC